MVHFMLCEFQHNKQKGNCVLPSFQRYTKLWHNHSIEDWKGLSLLKSGEHYPKVTMTGRGQNCVPQDSRSYRPHLPKGTVWFGFLVDDRIQRKNLFRAVQYKGLENTQAHSGKRNHTDSPQTDLSKTEGQPRDAESNLKFQQRRHPQNEGQHLVKKNHCDY